MQRRLPITWVNVVICEYVHMFVGAGRDDLIDSSACNRPFAPIVRKAAVAHIKQSKCKSRDDSDVECDS